MEATTCQPKSIEVPKPKTLKQGTNSRFHISTTMLLKITSCGAVQRADW
jgi:hypothetical protein